MKKKFILGTIIGAVAVVVVATGIIIGANMPKKAPKKADASSSQSDISETNSNKSELVSEPEGQEEDVSSVSSEKKSPEKTSSKKEENKKPEKHPAQYITEEKAIKIAKKHVGANEADIDVDDFVLDLDDKDGIPKYKFALQTWDWRNEYVIHAVTGKILSANSTSAPDYDAQDADGDSIRVRTPISTSRALANLVDAFDIELNVVFDGELPCEYIKHPDTPYFYIKLYHKFGDKKTYYGIVEAKSGKILDKSVNEPLDHLMRDDYITKEKAIEIATTDFGGEYNGVKATLDMSISYDEAFYAVTIYYEGWDTWEYGQWEEERYEIDALTGKILDRY